eukprot:13061293-Alexandrium_andersonii.AAC.1
MAAAMRQGQQTGRNLLHMSEFGTEWELRALSSSALSAVRGVRCSWNSTSWRLQNGKFRGTEFAVLHPARR